MTQSEVTPSPTMSRPRHTRPADVDERTWRGLKNATRWMLVQKYGPSAQEISAPPPGLKERHTDGESER